ncbi:amino acid adenylation domain-containing protein, partial [Lonsdalea quercina]|uniref:amino acid adenylation domain-containing protein n=1 Tax=Lonsdalea quercina TaxID=71657 RepID=UPI0039756F28
QEAQSLRDWVAAELPDYMLPGAWVHLSAWPLTAHGKLDRRALPEPDAGAYAVQRYEAPQGETETALAGLWASLLGVEAVGRHDHFFALGGHSLLAIQLLSRVRQQLGRDVALSTLFAHPVLAAFAQAVEQAPLSALPPIAPADRTAPLALSFAQQRLWFLSQLEANASAAYHMAGGVRLEGELNVEALQAALDGLVARHESLRTGFVAEDGTPYQQIHAPAPFALVVDDLRGHPEPESALSRLSAEEAGAPFDLERGGLVRGRLIRLDDRRQVLLFTLHHIISDGWSVGLFMRELGALYDALTAGKASPLPPLRIQYADYAAWQRRWIDGPRLQTQLGYWREQLAEVPPLLALPTDRPRPAVQDYAGGRVDFTLDAGLTAGLKKLAARHDATLYMTLLTGWAMLLHRLSGQDDIVIGSPVAGRTRTELEPLIGLFVNMLALRCRIADNATVGELLAQVKATTLAAQAHQDLPFEQLVEALNPVRSLAHSPLFQTMLAWQNAAGETLQLGDLQGRLFTSDQVTAQFDLSLTLGESDDRIEGGIEYASSLFDRETVERYVDHWQVLLRAMMQSADQPIARLPLLSDAERQKLLHDWNDTRVDYPQNLGIHQLFETHVQRAPEAVALVCDEQSLSYDALNQRANRLAHALVAQGVVPDTRVAICLPRCVDMVVAVLAVLKAGGAYVPIDPDYPADRINYILDDSQPRVVVTRAALWQGHASEIAMLDPDSLDGAGPWPVTDLDTLALGLSAHHLAYVIYTSGSTGKPKGVMIEHRHLCHQVTALQHRYALNAHDRVLQFAPFTFDMSVEEIFGALCSGAALVLRTDEWVSDASMFWQLCQDHAITVANLPVVFWNTLIRDGSAAIPNGVRQVMIGGEAVSHEAIQCWYAREGWRPALFNAYGPTEATVNAAVHRIESVNKMGCIGRPLANTRVYVLDKNGEPVPVGVAGELFIGGAGVARGYLNRDDLTAACFMSDPFANQPGARMYKTGDRVRWHDDGSLEYLGRNDHQVKIRGFRIELGEIEARLRSHGQVTDCVVTVAREGSVEARLVAYYLAPEPQNASELRSWVAEQLPDHMLPAAWVHLAAWPLTSNGKLDRKALPPPDVAAYAQQGYVAPLAGIETTLASLWGDLLEVERVGRFDNFFALGGHSLLAVQLLARMRPMALHADVSTLFMAPVLSDFALCVSAKSDVADDIPDNPLTTPQAHIVPEMLPLVTLSQEQIDGIVATVPDGAENVQDIYPLTSLQEGILFHHLLSPESDPYVEITTLKFAHRDALNRFLGVLQTVVERHDILRTAFVWQGLETPLQIVYRHAALPVVEVEYSRESRLDTYIDIRRAPLLHCRVSVDPMDAHVYLELQTHQLAVDHTALDLMVDEIRALLDGDASSLPPTTPFRHFVMHARREAQRDDHEAFFQHMLQGVTEPTAPFGHVSITDQWPDVQSARALLDNRFAAQLREIAQQSGVSVASVFHLAWAVVLGRTSETHRPVFGTVLLGRMKGGEGIERAMGMFINTLPICIDIQEQTTLQALQQAHQRLASLLEREHAPLSLAQRCSGVPQTTPLFSSLLNFRHSQHSRIAGLVDLSGTGADMLVTKERTHYPFTLNVDDTGQSFLVEVQVCGQVDAHRLKNYLVQVLNALVTAVNETPDTPACALSILPDAERNQLLHVWNAPEADDLRDVCFHHGFEAQVARTPQAPALIFGQQTLSYETLNRRANRLAYDLISFGVTQNERVALCLPRGVEMVVAMLAVLKAGGAYIPIDPSYPAERIDHMLEDSQPRVTIVSGDDLRAAAQAPAIIDVSAYDDGIAGPDRNPEPLAHHADALAYIIYTSGSTGRPKGVMVGQRALWNLLSSFDAELGLTADDRWLAVTTIAFDIAALELFLPLLSGAAAVVASHAESNDPARLADLIQHSGITTMQATPATWRMLLDNGWSGHSTLTALCGGEALNGALAARLSDAVGLLLNVYGPTETTIWSTAQRVSSGLNPHANVPIGQPIAHTQVYVLDSAKQLAPVGIAGELYIGGEGVAQGYLHQPALTAERFVDDPFSTVPGRRLYKTGDRVRWRDDGVLEYLGRDDHQVKIRGFRIELGEIEARLRGYADVADAAVVARKESDADVRLVAYYLSPQPLAVTLLRDWVAEQLPDYMLPSAWVHLVAWPLTPNGKLDRRALPAPDSSAYQRQIYIAPQGETETALAELWADLLGLERVGRDDHFFALGGHSLLAIQLLSRIRRTLGREITLNALFAHPLLADFAQIIEPSACRPLAPIVPVDRDSPLALSFAQQRLWFLMQLEARASIAYHIAGGVILTGALNVDALQAALDRIVVRHESLRTRFVAVNGTPSQQIHAAEPFALARHDLRSSPDADEALRRMAEHEAAMPFDVTQDGPIRGRLIRLDAQRHVLLVTMHHLVSDGWSLARLMEELNALYPAFCRGERDPLPPLTVHYADFAAWQRQWMQGSELQTQLAYWREQLADVPPLLELPTDRPRPAAQDYAGGRVDFRLDADLTGELKALAVRHDATLYMTLLTGWAILLHRLSGQDDLVIGSPVAGRTRVELEPLMGFFVNTLALRCRVDSDTSVGALLGQVKDTTLAAQAHQDVPFEQLVEALNPTRSLAHSPLFQTLFVWHNEGDDVLRLEGITAEPFNVGQVTTQFDLSMTLGARADCLEGSLEYASSLFDRETVARYVEHWQVLLRALVRSDDLAVAQLPLLTEAQRRQMVYEWNATRKDYPNGQCLHQLIEAQSARTPQAIALVYDDRQLSYGNMNEQANALAHELIAHGVGPDGRVAICLPRSLEMAVAVLATLKAGGAYVPIDPAYPIDRINTMLADCAPRVLITRGNRLIQGPAGTLVIDLDHAEGLSQRPTFNPDSQGVMPHHLAYVIYTSGSTGKPKGVMIEHRAIVNRLMWMQDEYRLAADDVVLQKTPLGFDVSVWELFWPLMVGVPLVLARHEGQKDPDYLAELIQRKAVTTVHFVPPMLQAFLSSKAASGCGSLRRIICSGEGLGSALARQTKACLPRAALFNLYGPTEAAVDVTAWPALGHDTSPLVPIGRPIANTQTYVLDNLGQPVPVGVVGELYLGGVQLARGYLGRPTLTTASFIEDPFSVVPAARLYKTGDRARWRADGVLEYLGRNDHQVKIRGFRIELGEIEALLDAHEAIHNCMVTARAEENGETRLVAYYLSEQPQPTEALRGWLAAKLPDYMLPSAWVHLAAWPLTPNGKRDRRALPAPDASAYQQQAYAAPQGETESALAELWAELLGIARVGRDDNFFTLGGHSLLAIQLVSRIRHEHGREVALSTLFTQPVLANFAARVDCAPISSLPAITLADRAQPLALSFAQQRLWFLTQLEARASTAYHIAGGLKFSGELDRDALHMALDRIVARHEALRTRFVEVEGTPYQQIDEPAPFSLTVHDLRGRPAAADELRQLADEEATEPFDLQQGPPIRGRLILLSEREQVLLVTLHHIVADGWSLSRFMRELAELYRAFRRQLPDPLPPLAIQYADYAVWQRRWLQGDVLQSQLAYWREQLADAPPLLELPTDRPRPSVQDYIGERIDFTLDASLTAELKALAARHDSTLYMTLLTGWTLLLHRLSGQDDIVVGSPVAGRTRTELEPLIGFFVNTLALRHRVDGAASVGTLLAQVKETTLAAQAHQDLPFEQLVEALNPTRSLSHSPLFQTLLAWQNLPDDVLQLDGVQVEPFSAESVTAKFDLLVSLEETGASLSGSLDFAVSVFDRVTVARMLSHWQVLLRAMVSDETLPVAQLPLLTDDERHSLLHDRNHTEAEPVCVCLHQQFEAQARREPQAIALVFGEQRLSYDELNRRANQLAHALMAQGVGPESRVAISLPRGVEMVVAVLAVLKAGGGYVPI